MALGSEDLWRLDDQGGPYQMVVEPENQMHPDIDGRRGAYDDNQFGHTRQAPAGLGACPRADSGHTVQVSREKVYENRISLATTGLPDVSNMP